MVDMVECVSQRCQGWEPAPALSVAVLKNSVELLRRGGALWGSNQRFEGAALVRN